MDGSGDAHVSTYYGLYAIDLNEFSRDDNVIIIHDDEHYKEELIEKLMHFLMHEVAPQMIINVLSQEGLMPYERGLLSTYLLECSSK